MPERIVDGTPSWLCSTVSYAYPEYAYDANGNTSADGLRSFSIEYNVLNLPAKIRKGGDSIEYVYSAKGEKLAKKKNGAVVNYYCGNMV
ncbi:MAG: hypothetical protein LBL90_09365, partial [Prevotellaceae bacterium]|nr:hypothetical protein [Prevotellaceae bacterium]